MADIRSYTRGKEKSEQTGNIRRGKLRLVKSESEEDFQQKLRKHRLSYVYRIGLLVLVCAVIAAIIAIQYYNKTYEDYDVIDTAVNVFIGVTPVNPFLIVSSGTGDGKIIALIPIKLCVNTV